MLSLQGEYKFAEVHKFRGRMNQNSRASWVNWIGKELTPMDWERVSDGPFGPVLKMVRRVNCSAQLMHALLFNQVQTLKERETWYKVRGKYARFSMKEFALITGLNCRRPNPADMVDDKKAVEALFSGREAVKVSELLTLFLTAQRESSYKMKVALLMVVEGVILGTDKNRHVRPWVVKLLEDMDKFYDFPWGWVSYEETHKSLSRSMARRMETKTTDCTNRAAYQMGGIVLAFQVLALLYVPIPLVFTMRLRY